MAQGDLRRPGSTGTLVRFQAWHRGLRILQGCSWGSEGSKDSDQIPGRGTPYAVGQQKKKKEKVNK